jgi:hypothetical protein
MPGGFVLPAQVGFQQDVLGVSHTAGHPVGYREEEGVVPTEAPISRYHTVEYGSGWRHEMTEEVPWWAEYYADALKIRDRELFA